MLLIAVLTTYAVLVSTLAAPVLTRMSRRAAAPRAAIVAWVSAMAGVLLAFVVIAALGLVLAFASEPAVHRVFTDCLHAVSATLGGVLGAPVRTGVAALVIVLAALIALGAGRVAVALWRARAATLRHGQTARLVGDVPGGAGYLVVTSAVPVVYCVPGRPAGIVVTTGALDLLDPAQLAAVLAHERAHLAGRHHLLVATSRAAALALPRLALLRSGADSISRLVEMCADDVAVRRHPGAVLVGALLTLAGGGRPPQATLGAGASDVADRVDRLLAPPPRRVAAPAAAALTVASVVALVPVVAVLVAAVVPGLCPPAILV